MSRVRSFISTWSVVTVAALALAACGSSSGSKATTTSSKGGSSGTQSSTADTTGKTSGSGTSVSCGLVPPAQIQSALGIAVDAPTVQDNPPVTVCTYKQSSGIGQVLVRFETAMDEAGWAATKSGFGDHGETIQDLSGLGDKAFTSTIGSGQFVTNTVVTEKGSTNLLVTSSASLAQNEALARQILTSL